MPSTSKTLVDAAFVGAVSAPLYTSPAAGKGTYVDVATAMNDNAAAQTLTLNIVPSGGAVNAANARPKAKSIAAGATDLLPEIRGVFLDPGDSIHGNASVGAAVSVFLSGRELT